MWHIWQVLSIEKYILQLFLLKYNWFGWSDRSFNTIFQSELAQSNERQKTKIR